MFLLLKVFVCLVLICGALAADQVILNSDSAFWRNNRGLNLSGNAIYNTLTLASIKSTDEFTTLIHPDIPGHRVRVKKTNFCDPTVKYVTVNYVFHYTCKY